jgi:hypothetical protein
MLQADAWPRPCWTPSTRATTGALVARIAGADNAPTWFAKLPPGACRQGWCRAAR